MSFLISMLFLLFSFTPLSATSSNTTGNDTLIGREEDPNDLLKYLAGTWKIKGTWQVLEGRGKVQYSSRATLTGTETYKTILNGHFMEKTLDAKVSYYSRDYGKKESGSFSTLTLYTYNKNASNFFFWYYDSTGAFLEASGSYLAMDNQYSFITETVNDKGDKIDTMHVIQIVDDNTYTWEVRTKSDNDYEWAVSASGSSERVKKS